MYICICKAVTDTAIKKEISSGCSTMKALGVSLGVGRQCGRCACDIKKIIKETVNLNLIKEVAV